MTIDYSNATNERLRKIIAERLGWRIERLDEREWIAYDPDDRKHRSFASIAIDYATALSMYTPDWPRDANAALELLIQLKGHDLHPDGRGQWVVYRLGGLYISHQNPARAICEAWLQWQDMRRKSDDD